jgi:LexA-binding, inner membrane-associated putative hydrolase
MVGAALAPDLDLLGRFVDGTNHHQGKMHSVGAAVLAAAGVWLISRWQLALATAAGWLSHIFLDYLGRDTSPPIGLMALWPFSSGYYKSPIIVFLDIGRTLDLHTLWHNGLAMAWECLLLLPIFLAVWRVRSGSG